MRHRGARGSSQVHDLCSRLDMDLVHSSQNSCSQLGAEWIPGSVFNLCLPFLKNKQKNPFDLLSEGIAETVWSRHPPPNPPLMFSSHETQIT